MDVLESNIIEESLGVEQDQQSSRRDIAATRVGVRKLVAEGEKAASMLWMKHYEIVSTQAEAYARAKNFTPDVVGMAFFQPRCSREGCRIARRSNATPGPHTGP